MNTRENIKKKVIILGIDGMDPIIAEQLMQEGVLPNFSYLRKIGAYSHLVTTNPPVSAVAWTSFATGLNPGSHGIFDFIMRNPQSYLLDLGLNEISNIQGKVNIKKRRKGEAFWGILSKNKVPSFIFFCPNTFPPDVIFGKMLSGMGVPDITGTMGRFLFYTTKKLSQEDKESRGKIIFLESANNILETKIYGPRVTLGNSITEATIPLMIIPAAKEKKVSFQLQGNNFHLEEGKWSSWQQVCFNVSQFKKVHGVVRFYLKSVNPELELYASPINFDPQKPLFPISYPRTYSAKLAKRIGLYYTQGMPYDTWALTEDRLDEKAFLEMVDEILSENEKILYDELRDFKSGVFFFYLETLDVIQHMFWRYSDTRHPLYEKNPFYQDTIAKYYQEIDRIIGEILKNLDKKTTLIILSDHGFTSFRKAAHLNRWLLENEFLSLKRGRREGREFFEDIDWSKTKAYAAGFGGIYLNIVGREGYGTVSQPAISELKQAIAEGLKGLIDPQTGEPVVKNVYFQEEIFKGPRANEAPDLWVGFNAGYRASWQTALGGVPGSLLDDNKKKWSGDHLVDYAIVPGVVFINKKAELSEPSIIDIAPTILDLFDIVQPNQMQGKVLFKDKNK